MFASLENKANELISEAEQKMSAFSIFRIFFSKTNKTQAIERYERAANLLKVSKNWNKSAICFCRCAELNLENGSKYDAAICFSNATLPYRKCNKTQRAIECLENAAAIFNDLEQYNLAGKHHQSIAEIYELHLLDISNAIKHYEQAEQFFIFVEDYTSSYTCLLKVAHYAAIFKDYQRAIEIYHEVCLNYGNSQFLTPHTPIYLLKAALCHMCSDILCGKQIVQKYEELFPLFSDSEECKYLHKIVDIIEDGDLNSFITSKFNLCSKLHYDDLIKVLLTRIQKILSNGQR